MSRRIVTAKVLLLPLALGAAVFTATSAAADPASCDDLGESIGYAGDGRLRGDVAAFCNDPEGRYYRGEIKWDKNFSPDPLVASETDYDLQTYRVIVDTCDNRNTRSYYARGFFTSGSDYHDSAHRHLTPSC